MVKLEMLNIKYNIPSTLLNSNVCYHFATILFQDKTLLVIFFVTLESSP